MCNKYMEGRPTPAHEDHDNTETNKWPPADPKGMIEASSDSSKAVSDEQRYGNI